MELSVGLRGSVDNKYEKKLHNAKVIVVLVKVGKPLLC